MAEKFIEEIKDRFVKERPNSPASIAARFIEAIVTADIMILSPQLKHEIVQNIVDDFLTGDTRSLFISSLNTHSSDKAFKQAFGSATPFSFDPLPYEKAYASAIYKQYSELFTTYKTCSDPNPEIKNYAKILMSMLSASQNTEVSGLFLLRVVTKDPFFQIAADNAQKSNHKEQFDSMLISDIRQMSTDTKHFNNAVTIAYNNFCMAKEKLQATLNLASQLNKSLPAKINFYNEVRAEYLATLDQEHDLADQPPELDEKQIQENLSPHIAALTDAGLPSYSEIYFNYAPNTPLSEEEFDETLKRAATEHHKFRNALQQVSNRMQSVQSCSSRIGSRIQYVANKLATLNSEIDKQFIQPKGKSYRSLLKQNTINKQTLTQTENELSLKLSQITTQFKTYEDMKSEWLPLKAALNSYIDVETITRPEQLFADSEKLSATNSALLAAEETETPPKFDIKQKDSLSNFIDKTDSIIARLNSSANQLEQQITATKICSATADSCINANSDFIKKLKNNIKTAKEQISTKISALENQLTQASASKRKIENEESKSIIEQAIQLRTYLIDRQRTLVEEHENRVASHNNAIVEMRDILDRYSKAINKEISFTEQVDKDNLPSLSITSKLFAHLVSPLARYEKQLNKASLSWLSRRIAKQKNKLTLPKQWATAFAEKQLLDAQLDEDQRYVHQRTTMLKTLTKLIDITTKNSSIDELEPTLSDSLQTFDSSIVFEHDSGRQHHDDVSEAKRLLPGIEPTHGSSHTHLESEKNNIGKELQTALFRINEIRTDADSKVKELKIQQLQSSKDALSHVLTNFSYQKSVDQLHPQTLINA